MAMVLIIIAIATAGFVGGYLLGYYLGKEDGMDELCNWYRSACKHGVSVNNGKEVINMGKCCGGKKGCKGGGKKGK